MFDRLFSARTRKEAAGRAFDLLTRAWRDPALFGEGRFPDDPDGRFEACALFAAVLFTRLAGRGDQAEELGQAVFDRQFKAFDQALRDLGVGDIHVGKRLRKMAESFYGRLAAYRPAIEARDPALLAEGIARNLFTRDPVDGGFEREAATAALTWFERLLTVEDAVLLDGRMAAA